MDATAFDYEISDGNGYSFTDAEYKSNDESLAHIDNGSGEDIAVAYDILSSRGDMPCDFVDKVS